MRWFWLAIEQLILVLMNTKHHLLVVARQYFDKQQNQLEGKDFAVFRLKKSSLLEKIEK